MPVVNKIRGSKAPNLPISPVEYTQRYHDQFSNVLRLYFNELDNLFAALFSDEAGGHHLKFPYGSFYQNGHTELTGNITNNSTTPIPVTSTAEFATAGFIIIENEIIQYTGKTSTTFTGITRGAKSTTNVAHNSGAAVSEAAAVTAGTSAAAIIDTVVVSSGVYVGSPSANVLPDSKIYFGYDGIFNIQFSMQLLNYTSVEDNVTVWFKKNNVDIPASASIEQVNSKHGSTPGATIMALNFVDSFVAGDYVELYWTSDSGNTILATYPPGTSPVHPASPSMILTVSFVSALP